MGVPANIMILCIHIYDIYVHDYMITSFIKCDTLLSSIHGMWHVVYFTWGLEWSDMFSARYMMHDETDVVC